MGQNGCQGDKSDNAKKWTFSAKSRHNVSVCHINRESFYFLTFVPPFHWKEFYKVDRFCGAMV